MQRRYLRNLLGHVEPVTCRFSLRSHDTSVSRDDVPVLVCEQSTDTSISAGVLCVVLWLRCTLFMMRHSRQLWLLSHSLRASITRMITCRSTTSVRKIVSSTVIWCLITSVRVFICTEDLIDPSVDLVLCTVLRLRIGWHVCSLLRTPALWLGLLRCLLRLLQLGQRF